MLGTRPLLLAAVAGVLTLSACAPATGGGQPEPTQQTQQSPDAGPDTDAGEGDAGEPASPAPGGKSETVEIVDFAFATEDIEVAAGTTVTWLQQDDSLHTVDFDDGESSGDLETGESYSRTFDEPGEYPYDCFYHPRMTGTVTVTGG
ncbi:Plastocyanin [Haloechinothrix alba]|uniref:Plastocyanin n=1 Tax=Haloechinothrix alba TaxID=664784 RepID=A0A238XZF9_9PSEU|nr:Plastocyanin [Haloechinothrix alba]